MPRTLLAVKDLKVFFPILSPILKRPLAYYRAVNGVSLSLLESQTLALVGESGCGKTTLGKSLLGLVPLKGGSVHYRGENIDYRSSRSLRLIRKEVQMIFQDPYSSLNPRHRIGTTLMEALLIHKIEGNRAAHHTKAIQALKEVGLSQDSFNYYPHQFSGGQRQRISIARALILKPKIIIADEPVSALDVSIQAQIINLLSELQKKHKLSYLFISHDLSVVKHLSDRVFVMYLGKIVESADTKTIFNKPCHPYTASLLKSIPLPDPRRRRKMIPLQGELPNAAALPRGCAFHPRCPNASNLCHEQEPLILPQEKRGQQAACHHPNG